MEIYPEKGYSECKACPLNEPKGVMKGFRCAGGKSIYVMLL